MITTKICSALASDPDFIEILEEFVAQIPERIRSIRSAIDNRETPVLCTLVHQLRGACGSYGFHEMTTLATDLEIALRSGKPIDELSEPLDAFLDACSRMTIDVE